MQITPEELLRDGSFRFYRVGPIYAVELDLDYGENLFVFFTEEDEARQCFTQSVKDGYLVGWTD